MEQVFDCDTLNMCKAFVNKDSAEKHCDVESVHMDGHNVVIEYHFPTSMGTKYCRWDTNMLELMAFVWSQQP